MARRLTQKQETFTQNVFKGMYQRDAYMDAYHPKYALATIDANASRLAHNEKVLARWEELRQEAEDASIATVVERKQRLTVIIREDIISPKTGALIRSGNLQATDLLNKMDKLYEAEAHVTVDNRTLNIYVVSEKAKELLQEVMDGSGTERDAT